MAEAELERRLRRLDLEERARAGGHRERGALVPNAEDVQDPQPPAVEGDLARPTVEPISSNPYLNRLDSDHRHFAAPFGGATRAPVTGHWCRERLFDFDWTLDRTPVRCQAPWLFVERIVERVCVTLSVTTVDAISPFSRVSCDVVGQVTAVFDGGAEVPLERRRHPTPQDPRARDRTHAEALPDLVGRLDD